jgi:hypothetical protein
MWLKFAKIDPILELFRLFSHFSGRARVELETVLEQIK